MKGFMKEFKAFIAKGNVMNLAVGVIIGAAFQAITTSLVNDIISPFLGLFTPTDMSGWTVMVGNAEIRYGAFLTAIVNFLVMAFVVFLLVKFVNKLMDMGKKEEAPAAPTTKKCPFCCSDIPLDATRCPHCTSEIPEEEAE